MPRTFLAPPGWPVPPAGWTPPVDWQPDPSWPAAPADWVWWAEDEAPEHTSADLQAVGAAAFAPVHEAPTYAPGFQPTPPPPGFHGAPGHQASGGFLPTGGPQPGTFQPGGLQQGGFQPSGFQQGGFQPSGFQQGGFQQGGFQPGTMQLGGLPPSGVSGFGVVAPPSFLHIADQLRAEAKRRALFGVLWLVGGLVVTGAFYLVAEPGGRFPIFWGAALYGLVQVVRGLVGYGRADKVALERSAGVTLR